MLDKILHVVLNNKVLQLITAISLLPLYKWVQLWIPKTGEIISPQS